MRVPCIVAALALAACSPPPPTCEVKQPLVEADAWRLLPRDEDPFVPLAPGPLLEKNEEVDGGAPIDGGPGALTLCADEDVTVEPLGLDDSLQLTTQFCSWMTVEQPLRSRIEAGERVFLRVWYFAQTSYPAATAELSMSFGDEPFWSASVPIPTESGLLAEEIEIASDVAEGTPVRWHVGNHGGNSWNLIELSALREGPCPDAGGAP